MFGISYFLLCCIVLSCNAYLRCDNAPSKRQESEGIQMWPANTVPYEIGTGYSNSDKELIRNSLKELSKKTGNCVKFHEKTSKDRVWVRVISADGCWSPIGKIVTTGYQNLSLDMNGCMEKSTVIHEFLHTLGFSHEQARPDRDKYIKVIYENVQDDQKGNYDIEPDIPHQSVGLPYDFDSVMQYVNDGFSINCLPTMMPLDAKSKKWRFKMGTNTGLSSWDAYKIKRMFKCR